MGTRYDRHRPHYKTCAEEMVSSGSSYIRETAISMAKNKDRAELALLSLTAAR